MKIINLSLANFPAERDPTAWIGKSLFFKGIWEVVACNEKVIFIEFIRYNGAIKLDKVEYRFRYKSRNQLKFPLSVFHSIRRERADIIVVHGLHFPWQILLLKLFAGNETKIIAQHHGERPFDHFPRKWLQRLAEKCINAYFFTAKEQALAWRQIISEDKVKEVMEVSSVFYPISKSTARRFTKVKDGRTYIWVGHLNEDKDPLAAIKAFTQFVTSGNEACLYLIFQSEALLPEIIIYLEQHPTAEAAIKLIGKVSHEELLYWYNSVDFVIATSHREAGGVAVCEAMSCGCIPVLSDIPSFVTMTDGACGYIFEKGNVHSLYKTLLKTRTAETESEKAKVLKQFHKKMSFNAIAENIRDILHAL